MTKLYNRDPCWSFEVDGVSFNIVPTYTLFAYGEAKDGGEWQLDRGKFSWLEEARAHAEANIRAIRRDLAK